MKVAVQATYVLRNRSATFEEGLYFMGTEIHAVCSGWSKGPKRAAKRDGHRIDMYGYFVSLRTKIVDVENRA